MLVRYNIQLCCQGGIATGGKKIKSTKISLNPEFQTYFLNDQHFPGKSLKTPVPLYVTGFHTFFQKLIQSAVLHSGLTEHKYINSS